MTANTGIGVDNITRARARRRSLIHGRRILYVDDEALLRQAVTRLLRGAGAVCFGTGTHDQAVILLAFEPLLDLAILDFQMPGADVSRLVRRLLQQRPGLALVGTSATDRRSEFTALGVEGFLPKPWSLDDLIRVAGWAEAPTARDPYESTDPGRDLPESGDTRALPFQRSLTSGRAGV